LVDSAEDLRQALNRLLAEERHRAVSIDEVKGIIGDGVMKLVERALAATGADPARAPALLPRFLAFYEGNAAAHTRAYPGAREALEALASAGLRIGVVTNKPYAATLEILQALDLAPFFGAVVGGDTLPQRKPDPAPLLLAAERLGIEPAKILMVGDNHHDVRAARAAGMGVFAVTYGYSHVPHGELGADRLIDSLSEVPRLVFKRPSG
jgi:phosphoglycolate phosphatase